MFFVVALLVVLAAMAFVVRVVEVRELTPKAVQVHIAVRQRRR